MRDASRKAPRSGDAGPRGSRGPSSSDPLTAPSGTGLYAYYFSQRGSCRCAELALGGSAGCHRYRGVQGVRGAQYASCVGRRAATSNLHRKIPYVFQTA
jgi:hypothetical protein